MKIILLLIGCSLLLAVGFLAAFIWSVRNGQLDDSYTPSVRILWEEGEEEEKEKEKANDTKKVKE